MVFKSSLKLGAFRSPYVFLFLVLTFANSKEYLCILKYRNDPSMLCLGCSRSIKFFDIREGARPVCSVPVSNQVRSISAGDVHFCIACIIDDFACIYDRRHLKSPLYRMQVSYFVSYFYRFERI